MAKRKPRIVFGADPIEFMMMAVENTYPGLYAVVHYMDDKFFAENGMMEWATAKSENGHHIIFVNPYRTIPQITASIAKGAVAIFLEIDNKNFDEASSIFQEEFIRVGFQYHTLIGG